MAGSSGSNILHTPSPSLSFVPLQRVCLLHGQCGFLVVEMDLCGEYLSGGGFRILHNRTAEYWTRDWGMNSYVS